MTQTIYRPARRAQYTVVSNALMNDDRVSADALGVLVYLLSRPDDWVIHREQLMARFKIGRDKFQAIFRELSGLGYARLESVADAESGQLAGKRWLIIEEPEAENRQPENPSLGGATDERVSRRSEKPTVGKPGRIINTDPILNTDSELKTASPQPPTGAREGGASLGDDQARQRQAGKPDDFDRFAAVWTFGQGESEGAARAAYRKLSAAEREAAIRGAPAFQGAMAGRLHPPHASTYLAERKWTFKSGPAAATSPVAPAGTRKGASQKVDGSWWLAPDSPQLQRWHEYERRMSPDRKAKSGCMRPSEWPPGYDATPCAADRGRHAAA